MAGSKVALLLFSLAVATALPADPRITINWPANRPSWWPDSIPYPPRLPENPPTWWPDSLSWPPALPENPPSWWPALFPWPPSLPADAPTWWPDSLPWPPRLPEEWPEQWPDRPSFWPDVLPWPPALPELEEWPAEWPNRPSFWPESLPWPPKVPTQWPDRPSFWPENLPWPPALPEIQWPPEGINLDRLPYVPSRDNQFHLFTRENPSMSQPLMINNDGLLWASNYRAGRRTVVLVHDIRGSSTDNFNAIMVPALLAAGDVNIISVDWSAGSRDSNFISAFYSVLSGNFVARFLNWLSVATGGDLENFHLVGVGLGGLNVGFIGVRCSRQVGYITALDPSRGPAFTRFIPPLGLNVAKYSEVIHTDVGQNGYAQPLADVDIYPNGGQYQPGCGGNSACNRNRAVYFFAESIQTGGFTATQCGNWRDALEGNCHGPGSLNMGGLTPKTGSRGAFYLTTNNSPPFSRG